MSSGDSSGEGKGLGWMEADVCVDVRIVMGTGEDRQQGRPLHVSTKRLLRWLLQSGERLWALLTTLRISELLLTSDGVFRRVHIICRASMGYQY